MKKAKRLTAAILAVITLFSVASCASNVITGDGTDTDTSDTTTASSTSDASDTSVDTSDDPADTSDTTEAETTVTEDTSGTTSEPETTSAPETTGKGGKTTTAAETTAAPKDEPLDGSEGLEYELKGKYYTVIGIGTCTDAELVVPSRYMGKPVTAIAPGAFRGCDFLTSVYTPDSVTSIGNEAFADCPSIVSLDLSCLNGILHRLFRTLDSRTITQSDACPDGDFWNNWRIAFDYLKLSKVSENKYLIFPDDERYYSILIFGFNDEMEEQFFRIPKSLIKVSIRNGSLPIEKYFSYTSILRNIGTFSGFVSLKDITVPNEITELEPNTFSGCHSLKGNVRDGMRFIGSKSNPYLIFVGVEDTKITRCDIPKGCRFIIRTGATENFSYKDALEEYECMMIGGRDENQDRIYAIAKNTVSDPFFLSGAFDECSSLEELYLPDTVKSICDNAFSGCSSLKTLRLPKGITFDPFTFKGVVCPLCKEYGGFLFMGTEEEPYKYFVKTNDRSSKNYEVPEGALAVYIDGDMEVDEIKLPKSLVEFSCLEHAHYGFEAHVTKIVYAGTSEEWFSINFTCADDAYYWEVYEDGDPDYDDIFYEHDDESEPIPVECSDKTIYVWFDGMLSATGRRP